MQVAILVFGIMAGLAALGAFIVPIWQQRVRLELRFTGGYSFKGPGVWLKAQVENRGRSPIYDVELWGGSRSTRLNEDSRIAKLTLQPFTTYDFEVACHPCSVDQDDELTLTDLMIVWAKYGRYLTMIRIPEGPYSSERVKTNTQRWPPWTRFGNEPKDPA